MSDTPDTAAPVMANLPDDIRLERVSRVRRAIYSWVSTTICLVVPAALAFLHYETPLANKVVDGFLSYAELQAMLYLGAGTIDRSKILDRIGNAMGAQNSKGQ